jgi:hypothetical protein
MLNTDPGVALIQKQGAKLFLMHIKIHMRQNDYASG